MLNALEQVTYYGNKHYLAVPRGRLSDEVAGEILSAADKAVETIPPKFLELFSGTAYLINKSWGGRSLAHIIQPIGITFVEDPAQNGLHAKLGFDWNGQQLFYYVSDSVLSRLRRKQDIPPALIPTLKAIVRTYAEYQEKLHDGKQVTNEYLENRLKLHTFMERYNPDIFSGWRYVI